MRSSRVIGRSAALAAVLVAILAVVVIVLGGGGGYQVKALFQNASQIVTGDQVEVAGNSVGTVSNISITRGGLAQLTLDITEPNYRPLRQGTVATVRLVSLSGIASRYVDLRLGPGNAPNIASGGVIPSKDTTSAVDLDQLFNTLNGPTRQALQQVIQGSASEYAGSGGVAQAAWQYLNPAVVSTSVLFSEINRDTAEFTRFVVQSGGLLTDAAKRSTDLGALVQNLATTTQALASERTALGQSIQRLPGFMRLANTTFVNLRSALDDLTPLVNVSKPVAPKLRALLVQLEPLARDSVPTVQDLANIVSRPGPNNDLIDLTNLGVPLAAVTVHPVQANGKLRPGAFPQTTIALNNSTPELAIARPYAVDLTGWFEGYTHPGTIDANGSSSRIAPLVGLFSAQNGVTSPIPPGLAGFAQLFFGTGTTTGKPILTTGQGDRCPGSMERGAVYYPYSGYPCNPSQVPTGP
ncbi:MAG: MlaD family protein [Actinomycetota bacterium]|nr:MlaD family protein [Actinomycetota bacterium]